MKGQIIIATICILFSNNALADDLFTQGLMQPRDVEKLSSPVVLDGLCSEVFIIEWRPTPGLENYTSKSEKSIKILNKVCNFAVRSFFKFINIHTINEKEKFSQTLCLMPAEIDNHGQDVRNLNDINFRFSDRTKEFDENGIPYPIWGYHQRSAAYIYIRNDVQSVEFKTVFAHELFHALSWQYGVYNRHYGNKDKAEERMARRFTRFIGYNE